MPNAQALSAQASGNPQNANCASESLSNLLPNQPNAPPPSPGSLAVYASSAAQIGNETLKDQVQHLQKKIAGLEDARGQSPGCAFFSISF
jgi:hypothetical protein